MNLDNLTIEEVRAIQLADIRARLAAKTQGSWIATLDNHGWCISNVPDEGTPKERMETLARLCSGSPTSDTADACFIASAPNDIALLLAEVERLRGIQPEFPQYPPEGHGLPRYGLRWNDPKTPLSVPMDDGYWTPWHLANAEAERQREEVFAAVDAALDRFDCTCGRDDYRHRTSTLDGHNPTRCNICNGDPCPKCALDYALRDAR